MSIIEKPGKKLEARFVCSLCGCEYRELLKDCDIYNLSELLELASYDLQYCIWAKRDCPYCGLSNTCEEQDFKEVTNPYD